MLPTIRSIAVPCAVVTLVLSYGLSQQSAVGPQSADEARDWLHRCNNKEHYEIRDSEIGLSIFAFDRERPVAVPFLAIQSTSLTDTEGRWRFTIFYGENKKVFFESKKPDNFQLCKGGVDFLAQAARAAQQEADAKDASAIEEFRKQAKLWHDQSNSRTMPDSAYPHKVLAENAFKEKNIEKAIKEYKAGLQIFPYWPEGQFNLALLVAEQAHYRDAVLHMKYYLELVPDAPDIQAAKDKIIIWQDKLNDQRLRGELP